MIAAIEKTVDAHIIQTIHVQLLNFKVYSTTTPYTVRKELTMIKKTIAIILGIPIVAMSICLYASENNVQQTYYLYLHGSFWRFADKLQKHDTQEEQHIEDLQQQKIRLSTDIQQFYGITPTDDTVLLFAALLQARAESPQHKELIKKLDCIPLEVVEKKDANSNNWISQFDGKPCRFEILDSQKNVNTIVQNAQIYASTIRLKNFSINS